MPLPKPKSNETKDNFINRCMVDSISKEEFPDEKQRLAVCNSVWDEKKRSFNVDKNRDVERRVFKIKSVNSGISTRSINGKMVISGHAAVYNSDSVFMGFTERIAPGAFKKVLKKNPDVVALFNHDESTVFGRTGTNLKLKEDERGLFMEVDEVDDDHFRMVAKKINSGLVDKQSFAFIVGKDAWEDVESDNPKRTILEFEDLRDVSVVTNPAFPDTSVDITVAHRSLDKAKEEYNNKKTDIKFETEVPTNTSARSINIQIDKLSDEQFKTLTSLLNNTVTNDDPDQNENAQTDEVEVVKEESNNEPKEETKDPETITFTLSEQTSSIVDKLSKLQGENNE